MLKFYFLDRALHLVKIIHVQLANEGVHIVMLEVCRKDRLLEDSFVLDLKEIAVLTPRYALTVEAFVNDLV